MNAQHSYEIGDLVPVSTTRGIASETPIRRAGVPVSNWYALRVAPGTERATIGKLAREGIYAFCPMSKTARFQHGRKIEIERPTVTQIIYARFKHWPNWDVLKQRKLITGVFCNGVNPVILPKDVIRQLQGLPVKAERMRAAKEELLRVNAGDTVKLVSGPFEGFTVDVTRSAGGQVWWQTVLANGLPLLGQCDRSNVQKN